MVYARGLKQGSLLSPPSSPAAEYLDGEKIMLIASCAMTMMRVTC